MNVCGVPGQIESGKGSAFISKENKNFWSEQNIIREYGTPNFHTGTGLVERTIQSLKNLIKANLEYGIYVKPKQSTIRTPIHHACRKKENPIRITLLTKTGNYAI